MSSEPRHLHLYLPDFGPGETHLHIHPAQANGTATVTAAGPAEPSVGDSLQRLKDWSACPDSVQAVYDGLVAMGLQPRVAGTRGARKAGTGRQPYLNWTHPSHPRGAVVYLNAASLWFIGRHDIPRVAGLPGAEQNLSAKAGEQSDVRFPLDTPQGADHALAAVRLIIGDG
jgi:hypothetical protein